MKEPYALMLEKQYMPFAVFDPENNSIIGFKSNAPISALKAAKEHILMTQKFDDVSQFVYWNELIKKLGLENI